MEPENNQSPNPSIERAEATSSPPPPQTMPGTNQAIAHTPEVEKEKKKSKILPILGVVIVLLLLVLAGFFLWDYYQSKQESVSQQIKTEQPVQLPSPTPTIDPTAGWKTYTSSSGAYSFKYRDPDPDSPIYNYYVNNIGDSIQEIGGGGHIFFVTQELETTHTDPQSYWQGQTTESYTELPKENYTSSTQTGIDYWGNSYQNNALENITTVLKLELKPEIEAVGKSFRIFIVPHNNKLYKLVLDHGNYADQILSTFEFIEESDAEAVSSTPDTNCVISGCNGEICAAESMSSICVYKDEYACYTSAKCEVQTNGKCGWTQTDSLSVCLSSN